jgi:hypothetical protein
VTHEKAAALADEHEERHTQPVNAETTEGG